MEGYCTEVERGTEETAGEGKIRWRERIEEVWVWEERGGEREVVRAVAVGWGKGETMSPEKGENRSFWIADVPHTQYFNPPFALHAAYWHERFGEPTSAGCVNVSPIDAETLFGWSDPQVPEGWQGVTGAGATKENGATTAVVVHR